MSLQKPILKLIMFVSHLRQQFVVDLGGQESADSAGVRAILPLVQVAGTVTRRAVEPTWLTASNAKVGDLYVTTN